LCEEPQRAGRIEAATGHEDQWNRLRLHHLQHSTQALCQQSGCPECYEGRQYYETIDSCVYHSCIVIDDDDGDDDMMMMMGMMTMMMMMMMMIIMMMMIVLMMIDDDDGHEGNDDDDNR